MMQALSQEVTFDEFIAWYSGKGERRYELHNGEVVEMPKATGMHSEVAGFTAGELFLEIRNSQLPYFIPKECIIKAPGESGYEPDVIVLDKRNVNNNELRWQKESIITLGSSVKLIVEVVSTNWSDDYALKLESYESLGIPEYWIIDYLGLGGRRYIGNPKQPTFSIYSLIAGEYQVTQFRGGEMINSPTFPNLRLTTEQVFQAGLGE
jgi:Uma2 family endonuclease